MAILIVSATNLEIAPFLREKTTAEVLITGLGVPATVFHLTRQLSVKKYDWIIQAGIAGTFEPGSALGDVFLVEADTFADSGIDENGKFQTLFEKGLMDNNEFPYQDGWLVNGDPIFERRDLPMTRAVTVSKITSDHRQNQLVSDKFGAGLESMEGAAFHYVCLRQHIRFLQIRAVSNFVGERNKEKWEMARAIENLNSTLLKIIKEPARL